MTHFRTQNSLIAAAFLILFTGILSGCAGSPQSASLFVLDTATDLPTHSVSPPASAPIVMIMPVETAAYLNQGGIVYQTNPHQVVIAQNNRWASPLSHQLTDSLYTTLEQKLPGIHVVRVGSSHSKTYKLQTYIDQFLGRYSGKAYIAGSWSLTSGDGKTLGHQKFTQSISLESDGYPALVTSLANGWQHIMESMASDINPLIRAKTGS